MSYQNPHLQNCTWFQLAETYGSPNLKWCEETLCSFVSEPANTWSNLGYILISFLIAYLVKKKKTNNELEQFAPIIFILGICSFIYHFSNIYITQVFDFFGMFLFTSWTIGMNLVRLKFFSAKKLKLFYCSYTAILLGILHLMYLNEIKFQILILISAIFIFVTEFLLKNKSKLNYKYFYLAALFLGTAFGFSISDHKRIWCDPTIHNWFGQGHALWHWLSSIGIFFIFKHYFQPTLQK